MVIAIQYKISEATNLRNSLFLNVEAREENAVSCEGIVSTYSFSLMAQTGTCIHTKARAAITAKVTRIALTRPNTGISVPHMTGARYATAVPAINVNEMTVEMFNRSCWLCPSSGSSALYGVQ